MLSQDAWMLAEREKELECMYSIDEVLQNPNITVPAAMQKILRLLPAGFAYPEACRVQITLHDGVYTQKGFEQAQPMVQTPIHLEGHDIGSINISYLLPLPGNAEPFVLSSERKMLIVLGKRMAMLVLNSQRELAILFDMLQKTDPRMLVRILEKLRIHYNNLVAATPKTNEPPSYGEVNIPLPKPEQQDPLERGKLLISQVAETIPSAEIYSLVSGWIQEERLFYLVKAVDNRETEISAILDALRSYTLAAEPGAQTPTETWLIAELAHRFLTNDEHVINQIMDNLTIADFVPVLEKIIGSSKSDGHIGGKGAGLFIAQQILQQAALQDPLLVDIKIPRTWYIAADQMHEFLRYNQLEEMNAYKYHPISYLRMTYSKVVEKIKSSRLPPHVMRMLGILLDDFSDTPLIVRSSSLLEDRSGSAFSGKYKSLFLSNQGTKQQRLESLSDAILEVYSSQYNPDSIQYRAKRQLLNFTERMGIMIQEVVGTRIGPYYLPVFAGVAFSENPLRWSARIKRKDGLVRMVPGLGTRAVDRVNDDYPLLFSPAQPGLRINQTPEAIKRYSPKFIDVMNLEKGSFETLPIEDFLRETGAIIPQLHKLVSVYTHDEILTKSMLDLSPATDNLVVTFEGLLSDSPLPAKILHILQTLRKKLQTPVDIEFAFDGQNLYLLQCRPLGQGISAHSAEIPSGLPPQQILFSTNRFVTNGAITGITHIVYVNGETYSQITSREELLAVGNAVGLLNDILPRRKYILMGPGRWGSRGDIQLGVRVTYADICNSAALIEIAWEKQSYEPELSFGTHFFQDLVESDIPYIPLYPGTEGNTFNESLLKNAPNHLASLLPAFAHLSDIIYVVETASYSKGAELSIHMNANLEKALAFFTPKG